MCANPQKENGFTPIANEIFDALARTNLPCYERRIFDAILRHTYGYNRKIWKLKKWKDLCDTTGIEITHIQRTLKSLKDKHFISFDKEKKELSPLKNYENWKGYNPIEKVTSLGKFSKQKVTQSGNFSEESEKKVTSLGNKKVTSLGKSELPRQVTLVTSLGNFMPSEPAPPLAPQNPKDNIKTITKERSKDTLSRNVNLSTKVNPTEKLQEGECERNKNKKQKESVLTKDPSQMTQADWEEAERLAQAKYKDEEKEWYRIGRKLIEEYYPMYFLNQQGGLMNSTKNELVANIGMSYLAFPDMTKECIEEITKNLKKPENLLKWTYDKIMERKFNHGKSKRY